jgi:rhodanese-related sulfurtransferase
MKLTSMVCMALVLSAPLAAETALAPASAPAVSAAPTAVPTPLSTPQVTVDPRFTISPYAEKYPHISLDEAKRLQARRDVVFVDGRQRIEWDQSHIPGAIAMPLGEFDKAYAADAKRLKKARIIVSYCHGEGCRLSDALAQKLVDRGHRNVAVFWGGFPAWNSAGLPLEDKYGRAVGLPPK